MMLFRRGKRAVPSLPATKSPGSMTRLELAHLRLTDAVLVKPSVIADAVKFSADHPNNEVPGLLMGRCRGRYVVVERLHRIQRPGTASTVEFQPKDFTDALKKSRDGEMIVGWYHSHPRFGVFLSDTDILHQAESQEQWPEYVGLVMDPFGEDGILFGFLRSSEDSYERVPHHFYMEDSHEA